MAAETSDQKSQLRRAMGFWDVLLFNIAVILGPRFIAAAAHNGTSSISLWVLAAVLFFLPVSLIVTELATRFPAEGGFYVWSKEAFGDFHAFMTGWSYWVYTFFYFPGLLAASVAMGVFIGGPQYAWLADSKTFTLTTSLAMLAVAVVMNIVGLNIGKWLQNAGGIGTYVPLVMLVGVAGFIVLKHGSVTHFDFRSVLPVWNWGTVTFWSQIAFAFAGMELVTTMSEEVRDPQKTFPRAIYASAVLIVAIYIVATIAVLWVLPAAQVDIRNGVFQAISGGAVLLGIAWFGVLASLLVTAGNAGGVGGTVAGVARLPFVAGIDNYLPAFFGKIHPRWRTPWISILVQAGISAVILLLSLSATLKAGYLFLVDVAIILYYIPYLYMFASFIKLAYRENRAADGKAVLVPGGRAGAWLAGSLGFLITLFAIALATLPSEDVKNVLLFEVSLVLATGVSIGIGLVLYWRGKRGKERASQPGPSTAKL